MGWCTYYRRVNGQDEQVLLTDVVRWFPRQILSSPPAAPIIRGITGRSSIIIPKEIVTPRCSPLCEYHAPS